MRPSYAMGASSFAWKCRAVVAPPARQGNAPPLRDPDCQVGGLPDRTGYRVMRAAELCGLSGRAGCQVMQATGLSGYVCYPLGGRVA